MSPITIHDIAEERLKLAGNWPGEGAGINGAEYESVGLQIMGGCAGCGAQLAAYNAYPSTNGYWHCRTCLAGTGFDSVKAFDERYPSDWVRTPNE